MELTNAAAETGRTLARVVCDAQNGDDDRAEFSRMKECCQTFANVLEHMVENPVVNWDDLSKALGKAHSTLRRDVSTCNTWLDKRIERVVNPPKMIEGTPAIGQRLTEFGGMVWKHYEAEKKQIEGQHKEMRKSFQDDKQDPVPASATS